MSLEDFRTDIRALFEAGRQHPIARLMHHAHRGQWEEARIVVEEGPPFLEGSQRIAFQNMSRRYFPEEAQAEREAQAKRRAEEPRSATRRSAPTYSAWSPRSERGAWPPPSSRAAAGTRPWTFPTSEPGASRAQGAISKGHYWHYSHPKKGGTN